MSYGFGHGGHEYPPPPPSSLHQLYAGVCSNRWPRGSGTVKVWESASEVHVHQRQVAGARYIYSKTWPFPRPTRRTRDPSFGVASVLGVLLCHVRWDTPYSGYELPLAANCNCLQLLCAGEKHNKNKQRLEIFGRAAHISRFRISVGFWVHPARRGAPMFLAAVFVSNSLRS